MDESLETPPEKTEAPIAPEPAPAPEAPRKVNDLPDDYQSPSLVFFWVVTVVSTALDLASKEWASRRLNGYDMELHAVRSITIVKNHVDLQYAQNPGGAWSMLRNLPEIARRPFFLVVSTVASVFIASIYPRIDRRQWAMKWGLPLALGGAVGNLVDRMRHGWVVDFVHVWTKKGPNEYHWPTFNVADVWIVVGVGLMGLDIFFSRKLRTRLGALRDEPTPEAPPLERQG